MLLSNSNLFRSWEQTRTLVTRIVEVLQIAVMGWKFFHVMVTLEDMVKSMDVNVNVNVNVFSWTILNTKQRVIIKRISPGVLVVLLTLIIYYVT